MDNYNWRPTAAQGAEPSVETGSDWRTQLPPDSRQRIVNKIMEMLNRHLPFYSQEELEQLKKIAMRFEEEIYTAAVSQDDYLRKISLKMLGLESKYQDTIPNSLPSNPSGNHNRPPYPGASLDSNGGDWQEEVHQKIKAMKKMSLPELNEMYQKVSRLQLHDALPQPPKSE